MTDTAIPNRSTGAPRVFSGAQPSADSLHLSLIHI